MGNRLMPFVLIVALTALACGGGDSAPDESGLRDSFAAQLAANEFVSDVQRNGDEITFSGPTAEGDMGEWRVVIESAVIEPHADPEMPYRGNVMSSWYSNGQIVEPSGRDSNLPIELTSNGLAQECFALWNNETGQWGWE